MADEVIASLEPIRQRFLELTGDPAAVEEILVDRAERARPIATATLDRVKALIGLG